jgi:fluoride ion exporter CrcB/FEX
MNSALKRKQRKQKYDTLAANVLGCAILAATVSAIYIINYQIILIRYGA